MCHSHVNHGGKANCSPQSFGWCSSVAHDFGLQLVCSIRAGVDQLSGGGCAAPVIAMPIIAMMVLVDSDQGAGERPARLGDGLPTLFTLDEVRSARTNRWSKTAASG